MKSNIIKSGKAGKEMLTGAKNMIINCMIIVISIITRHVNVVLKTPRSFGGRLKFANTIHDAMEGNPWFPSPVPTMSDLKAAIMKYLNASAAIKLGGADAKDLFLKAWEELYIMLKQLRNYVEGICLLNPDNAAEIAHSAGMAVRAITNRDKQDFTAKPSGSGVELIGKIRAKRCSHEWQCTINPADPMGWYVKLIDSTLLSKTFVTGFDPGTLVYFRHRCIIKGGPTEWDTIISVRIP